MAEAVILGDVVAEVMVVIKTVGVTGKLEPLQHHMVGATGRQVIGQSTRRIRGSGVTNRHVELGDRVSRTDT